MAEIMVGIMCFLGAWQIAVTFFVLKLKKDGNGNPHSPALERMIRDAEARLTSSVGQVDSRLTTSILKVDTRFTDMVTRRNGEIGDIRNLIEQIRKESAASDHRVRHDINNLKVEVEVLKRGTATN